MTELELVPGTSYNKDLSGLVHLSGPLEAKKGPLTAIAPCPPTHTDILCSRETETQRGSGLSHSGRQGQQRWSSLSSVSSEPSRPSHSHEPKGPPKATDWLAAHPSQMETREQRVWGVGIDLLISLTPSPCTCFKSPPQGPIYVLSEAAVLNAQLALWRWTNHPRTPPYAVLRPAEKLGVWE